MQGFRARPNPIRWRSLRHYDNAGAMRRGPIMQADDIAGLTRRQWLGGAAALGAGALLPVPAAAQGNPWANVTKLIQDYVTPRKVANMVVSLGFGSADATILSSGVDGFTRARRSG